MTTDPIAAAEAASYRIQAYASYVGVDADADAIRAGIWELKQQREINRRACEDWAADDTAIRDACRTVLPAAAVDGDSHGVPTVVDVCESVVAALKAARERIAELEAARVGERMSESILADAETVLSAGSCNHESFPSQAMVRIDAWQAARRLAEHVRYMHDIKQMVFACPKCGGSHCGRSTAIVDGKLVMGRMACHDEFGVGCNWSGTWPPTESRDGTGISTAG